MTMTRSSRLLTSCSRSRRRLCSMGSDSAFRRRGLFRTMVLQNPWNTAGLRSPSTESGRVPEPPAPRSPHAPRLPPLRQRLRRRGLPGPRGRGAAEGSREGSPQRAQPGRHRCGLGRGRSSAAPGLAARPMPDPSLEALTGAQDHRIDPVGKRCWDRVQPVTKHHWVPQPGFP